jgi:uncharacterized membrane protein
MFLLVAFILILIDSIYLSLVKNHFTHQISIVQGKSLNINYLAVILCYILLVIGLVYFILIPKKPVSDAFLLGLIIYGVFETTNKALLDKWTWKTVVIDSLWGGILFAITTYIYYKIKKN